MNFVLDISLLEHVSLCVCVVLESLSRKSAAKQPEARKNSFSLSRSVSLFEFCFETKRMFTELQTHRQRFNDKSLLRSEEKPNVHNIRRRSSAAKQNLSHRHTTKLQIFSSSPFFSLLLALKIIRRLRLFDTPILSVSENLARFDTTRQPMTRSEFLPETKFL
jgi:hypothetical protein